MREEDILNYVKWNSYRIKIEKHLKELSDRMKREMIEEGITRCVAGEYALNLGEQNRGRIDNEKMVELLKDKGYLYALDFKEIYLESEVKQLLEAGMLTREEYNKCKNDNIINTIYVSKASDSFDTSFTNSSALHEQQEKRAGKVVLFEPRVNMLEEDEVHLERYAARNS